MKRSVGGGFPREFGTKKEASYGMEPGVLVNNHANQIMIYSFEMLRNSPGEDKPETKQIIPVV